MENHCIEEPFIIRSYRKSELAHLYNPDMPLVPAMRKMRYWIQRNPKLYEAMYRSGEARGDHRYTRRQVRLIVEIKGNTLKYHRTNKSYEG